MGLTRAGEAHAEWIAQLLLRGGPALECGYTPTDCWRARDLLAAAAPHMSDESRGAVETLVGTFVPQWEAGDPGSAGAGAFTLLTAVGEQLSEAGYERVRQLSVKLGRLDPGDAAGVHRRLARRTDQSGRRAHARLALVQRHAQAQERRGRGGDDPGRARRSARAGGGAAARGRPGAAALPALRAQDRREVQPRLSRRDPARSRGELRERRSGARSPGRPSRDRARRARALACRAPHAPGRAGTRRPRRSHAGRRRARDQRGSVRPGAGREARRAGRDDGADPALRRPRREGARGRPRASWPG